jgi:hypothetical protein
MPRKIFKFQPDWFRSGRQRDNRFPVQPAGDVSPVPIFGVRAMARAKLVALKIRRRAPQGAKTFLGPLI